MKNISKHITYAEATNSQTAKRLGIDNAPNECQVEWMKSLATSIFEPTRQYLKTPIYISSMFRSEDLNIAIGGATNSQHCKGQAMDLDADMLGGTTNVEIFNYILKNLDFDQLIIENVGKGKAEWVHVSYVSPLSNRKQVLIMYKDKGKTKYVKYTDKKLRELLNKK